MVASLFIVINFMLTTAIVFRKIGVPPDSWAHD